MKKTLTVLVRCSEEERDEWRRKAGVLCLTVSELIRDAIHDYMGEKVYTRNDYHNLKN